MPATERQKASFRKRYLRNKETVKARSKAWKAANRDKVNAGGRAYNRRMRLTLDGRYHGWKHSAVKRGLVWNLTKDDLKKMPLVCHYTGEALVFDHQRPNSVSLDRIDSSKGYTRDNVVFCCRVVNLMKHTMSVKDFKTWCRKVLNHLEGSK